MGKYRVAFATDDGKGFIDRHFGDAKFYDVYEISKDDVKYSKRILNTVEEEKEHADPVKAKGITGILKQEKIKIVVSKVFGPNIKRIKKKFVCIVTKEKEIEDALTQIKANLSTIGEEFEKGENRSHLVI